MYDKIETICEISKEQTLIHPGGETERNQVGSLESRDSGFKYTYDLGNMLISHPEIHRKTSRITEILHQILPQGL